MGPGPGKSEDPGGVSGGVVWGGRVTRRASLGLASPVHEVHSRGILRSYMFTEEKGRIPRERPDPGVRSAPETRSYWQGRTETLSHSRTRTTVAADQEVPGAASRRETE